MPDDHASDHRQITRLGVPEWTHICERCGERMEERKCKIVCVNCGNLRDCSDP
jgi:hypothetical protein